MTWVWILMFLLIYFMVFIYVYVADTHTHFFFILFYFIFLSMSPSSSANTTPYRHTLGIIVYDNKSMSQFPSKLCPNQAIRHPHTERDNETKPGRLRRNRPPSMPNPDTGCRWLSSGSGCRWPGAWIRCRDSVVLLSFGTLVAGVSQ